MHRKGGSAPELLSPSSYSMVFSLNSVPFFVPVPHLSWVVCLMPNSTSSLAGCWQVGESDKRMDGPEQLLAVCRSL